VTGAGARDSASSWGEPEAIWASALLVNRVKLPNLALCGSARAGAGSDSPAWASAAGTPPAPGRTR